MEYRPYKLLSSTELSEIEGKLGAAYRVWSDAWLTDELAVQIRCHRAAEYRGHGLEERDAWMYAGTGPDEWMTIGFASSFKDWFGGSLLMNGSEGRAPVRSSVLLNDLVMRAVADLIRPLCPWLSKCAPEKMPGGAGVPSQTWDAGSGAVIAELAWNEERMEFVFSATLVNALLAAAPSRPAKRTAFAKVADALVNERLGLKVLAGEAQLELGLLQTIAVGDVIKLNTRINEPLQVLTTDGSRFCNAFLGSCQGRKAVQLLP